MLHDASKHSETPPSDLDLCLRRIASEAQKLTYADMTEVTVLQSSRSPEFTVRLSRPDIAGLSDRAGEFDLTDHSRIDQRLYVLRYLPLFHQGILIGGICLRSFDPYALACEHDYEFNQLASEASCAIVKAIGLRKPIAYPMITPETHVYPATCS